MCIVYIGLGFKLLLWRISGHSQSTCFKKMKLKENVHKFRNIIRTTQKIHLKFAHASGDGELKNSFVSYK